MLPGFNHNIQHQGLLFHVQTEDMGEKSPYVVTTLFHEGNVVALRRTGYQKFIKVANRDEIVSSMMKEQHKDMMKDLVNHRLRAAQLLIDEKKGGAQGLPSSTKKLPSTPAPKEAPPPSRTLDADSNLDKTLDELILEFLSSENLKKP